MDPEQFSEVEEAFLFEDVGDEVEENFDELNGEDLDEVWSDEDYRDAFINDDYDYDIEEMNNEE